MLGEYAKEKVIKRKTENLMKKKRRKTIIKMLRDRNEKNERKAMESVNQAHERRRSRPRKKSRSRVHRYSGKVKGRGK